MSLEFQKRSHELEMQKMNEDFQTRVGELNVRYLIYYYISILIDEQHHHDIEKKQLERNIEDAAAEISRVSRQLELLQTPENSKTLEAYDTTHSLQGRISELETEVSRSKLSFDKMERLFKDATKKHDYLEAQQRKEREKETEIVNQQQLLLERTKELSTERESRETEIKRMQVEMDLAKQANNSLASSQERLKAELDEKIIELQRELAAEKQICKTAMELMKAEKDLETQAKDSLASTQERLKAQLDEKIAEHQRELAAEKQICKTEMERMKAEKDLETRAKDSLASSQERLRRTLEEKEKHSSEQKRLILGWEEELAAAKQGHETEMERMKAEKDLETRAKDSLASSHERLRTTLDEKEKHSNEQKRLLLERERELAAAEVTHDTALQAVQREKAVLLLRAQEAEDTVRKQREEFLQRANATAVEQDQSLATEREQLVHREDHLRHEKELIEAQRASLIARETDLASESRRCKEVLEAQHQSLLVREAEVDKQAQRLKELNSAAKGKGVDVGENHAGGLGMATGSDTAAPSTSTSSAGFAQGSGVGSATTTATTSAAATSGQCFTTRAGRKVSRELNHSRTTNE
jgi:hypothetical protein